MGINPSPDFSLVHTLRQVRRADGPDSPARLSSFYTTRLAVATTQEGTPRSETLRIFHTFPYSEAPPTRAHNSCSVRAKIWYNLYKRLY